MPSALALYGWMGIGVLVLAWVGIPLLGWVLREQEKQDDDD